jgi:hypothetical protein
MKQLEISHNGEYFVVGDMHFDHLRDAEAHARQERVSAV